MERKSYPYLVAALIVTALTSNVAAQTSIITCQGRRLSAAADGIADGRMVERAKPDHKKVIVPATLPVRFCRLFQR